MHRSVLLLSALLTVFGCVSATKTRVAVVPAGGSAVITVHAADDIQLVSGGDVEVATKGMTLPLSRGVPQSIPTSGKPRLVLTNSGDKSVAVRLLLRGGAGLKADIEIR